MLRQVGKDKPDLVNEYMQINHQTMESEYVIRDMVRAAMCILQSMESLVQEEIKLVGVLKLHFLSNSDLESR
jgi:hypothetical protein